MRTYQTWARMLSHFRLWFSASFSDRCSSLLLSPSGNWMGVGSLLASITSLAFKKLGWLVEERSLAHIRSVITTLFCLSVILCVSHFECMIALLSEYFWWHENKNRQRKLQKSKRMQVGTSIKKNSKSDWLSSFDYKQLSLKKEKNVTSQLQYYQNTFDDISNIWLHYYWNTFDDMKIKTINRNFKKAKDCR